MHSVLVKDSDVGATKRHFPPRLRSRALHSRSLLRLAAPKLRRTIVDASTLGRCARETERPHTDVRLARAVVHVAAPAILGPPLGMAHHAAQEVGWPSSVNSHFSPCEGAHLARCERLANLDGWLVPQHWQSNLCFPPSGRGMTREKGIVLCAPWASRGNMQLNMRHAHP